MTDAFDEPWTELPMNLDRGADYVRRDPFDRLRNRSKCHWRTFVNFVSFVANLRVLGGRHSTRSPKTSSTVMDPHIMITNRACDRSRRTRGGVDGHSRRTSLSRR